MTRSSRALPIALLLLTAACTPAADATRTAEPTDTPEPTPSPTAEATPSADPSESAEATPSPSMVEGEGGFTYAANDDADALMDETFSCQNLDDGYEVDFPAEWNTNAEFGEVPPCSWFAPTEYETGAPGELPDDVAIEIKVIDGDRGYEGEVVRRDEGMIGATQPATRVEVVELGGVTAYEYVVQLGPTLEEGPNLVARTSSEMGGDFDLNRAILDRMMSTMEFIGVIQ
jgi:hypothetical protein